MNNLTRKVATLLAALTVTLGAVAVAAPANAVSDTGWGFIKAPTSSGS